MPICVDDIKHIPGVELFTGNKLRHDIEDVTDFQYRECFGKLEEYLFRDVDKVHLLTGLRRTGKSVLLKQAIGVLPEERFERTVKLLISEDIDIHFLDVINLCGYLYSKGFREFFIDEATQAVSFPEESQKLIHDLIRHGCHVFVTGTNSLSMLFAKDCLQDNYEETKTTRIPYYEWNSLINNNQKNGIFDYMRYGGVLDPYGIPADKAIAFRKNHPFSDSDSIDYYAYVAIALNLQNSLAKYHSGSYFEALQGLYDDNLLTTAIMRAVKLNNYPIAVKAFQESFDFHDTQTVINSFAESNPTLRNKIFENKDVINEVIAERLCLQNNAPRLSKEENAELFAYLQKMDVFSLSDVYHMPPSDSSEYYRNYTAKKYTLQTQPGIRCGQIQAAIDTIWDILRVYDMQISYEEFDRIAGATARGHILENIILSDINDILPDKCKAVKLEWINKEAEFDIAVIDEREQNRQIALLGIKYDNHVKYLQNDNIINQVEEMFDGKVVSKKLLYHERQIPTSVPSINISEFLMDIKNYPDIVFDNSDKQNSYFFANKTVISKDSNSSSKNTEDVTSPWEPPCSM